MSERPPRDVREARDLRALVMAMRGPISQVPILLAWSGSVFLVPASAPA
jgi:hypothetical protein